MIKINDIVGRKSYNNDVYFRVIEIKEDNAILYGEDIRLIADAPLSDLQLIGSEDRQKNIKKIQKQINETNYLFAQEKRRLKRKKEYEASDGFRSDKDFFHMPGRVLHLDGDRDYLQKCLVLYKKMNVPVFGVHCHEKDMPNQIEKLLLNYRPDILVVTGHDAYSKTKGCINDIDSYRHSREFVKTVQIARSVVPHLDQLVIFAGACQSHFESLIQAGANFASSPDRINIHALDPVYVVSKISFTPFMDIVGVWDILRNTLSGEKGLGGIETRGVLRIGMPYKNKN